MEASTVAVELKATKKCDTTFELKIPNFNLQIILNVFLYRCILLSFWKIFHDILTQDLLSLLRSAQIDFTHRLDLTDPY